MPCSEFSFDLKPPIPRSFAAFSSAAPACSCPLRFLAFSCLLLLCSPFSCFRPCLLSPPDSLFCLPPPLLLVPLVPSVSVCPPILPPSLSSALAFLFALPSSPSCSSFSFLLLLPLLVLLLLPFPFPSSLPFFFLYYTFFQIDGAKRMIIGKISSLPASISNIITNFEK